MTSSRELLAASPALAGIPLDSLATLASLAHQEEVDAGLTLMRQGDSSDAVFVVVSGRFEVSVCAPDGEVHVVGEIGPGELIGEVQLIVGGGCSASVRALEASQVLRFARRELEVLVARHPQLLAAMVSGTARRLLAQRLAHSLASALGDMAPEQARELAAHAEWLRLQRGETLFRQGAAADAAYLLVSGLLLVSAERGSGRRILGEVRSGELVGELALILEDRRTATVVARRPSWLVRIGRSDFTSMVLSQPQRLLSVVRVLTARHRDADSGRQPREHTIALLPLSQDAPAGELARMLRPALQRWSQVEIMGAQDLHARELVQDPRTTDLEHPAWLRLDLWLEERRRDGTTVVLLADHYDNAWTRKVVTEADRIVLVGDATASPVRTELETALFSSGDAAAWETQRWLVLVHGQHTELPSGTAAWLDARRVDRHFHVRMGDPSHLERLGRWLASQAVGLALSGGAARGFAHVGVYRALQEAHLPVDFISGTSCGSLMGALLAAGHRPEALGERIRRGVSRRRNPFGDVSLPMMALLRSRRIRAMIKNAFGDVDLEDLWIPCAIVTTDLTEARRRVFLRGPVWKAGLASSSPPGVMLPVVVEGHVHCDGSVLDNLPVGVLAEHACRYRIASCVGTELDFALDREEWPSPWAMAWDRIFRHGQHTAGIPNIMEILVRSITLASDREMAESMADMDLFLQPPVASFPLLDFSSPEPLIEVGYQYARALIAGSAEASALRAALRTA